MQAPASCSVIIISYNSGSLLPSCLHSIFRALGGMDAQVIVFDNGSPNPLSQALKDEYSQVEWMQSDRNLGFGTACNRAAETARHPFLFFVNPDTLVSIDTFEKIIGSISQKADAGVVGCRILNGDGSLQWACRRSFPSPMGAIYKTLGLASVFPKSRTFGAYNLTYLDPEMEDEVDAVSGSFFCVRKDVYQAVGGFDEDFFLYGEDLDICYRIQKTGLHNYYYPGTSVIHFKGQSSKTRMLRSYIDFYQAMLIFARKHPKFLQPVPLWMISIGVFFAAGLGIFSRLLPNWGHLAVDSLMLVGFWFGTMQLGVTHLDWWGLLAFCGSVLVPLLVLGEYGSNPLELRDYFRKVVPVIGLVMGASVLFLGQKVQIFAFSLLGLSLIWLWRRMFFWFQYFRSVFSRKRCRSILLGNNESVGKWFVRENLVTGRDILGCVSSAGPGAARIHFLGSVQEVEVIRSLTGAGEILVVPDSFGRHEELPPVLKGVDGHFKTRLLIGHPDTSTFAMVDLNFLK
jgi:GT2 family glycosyltransferase